MIDKPGIIFVTFLLVFPLLISGCTEKKKDDNYEIEDTYITAWKERVREGSALGQYMGESSRTTHTIGISLEEENVVQILVNITYTDGDENTNPDEIHSVKLVGYDMITGEEGGSVSIGGGLMPFSGQLILQSRNGTRKVRF